MYRLMFRVAFIILIFWPGTVESMSQGAPNTACTSMGLTGMTSSPAQSIGSSPYLVNVSKGSYKPGDTITGFNK